MASKRETKESVALDFLEYLSGLGITTNAEDLENLYHSIERIGGVRKGLSIPLSNKYYERYNKLYGTNYTHNEFINKVIKPEAMKFYNMGYKNMPSFYTLKDATSYTDNLSFSEVMENALDNYYTNQESESSDTPAGTPTTPSIEVDGYDADISNPDVRETLLNAYYRDAYDINTEGTNANITYNNLVANNQLAATEAARLADLNAQQAAMQQAATVKSIADQVRNERMARLRAGMSESQIASQDMQSLMTNINALNQQAAEANLARLNAQSAYNTAQSDAYNAWLQQANAQATVGAASAAADAGDAINSANRYGYYNNLNKKFSSQWFPNVTGTTSEK